MYVQKQHCVHDIVHGIVHGIVTVLALKGPRPSVTPSCSAIGTNTCVVLI